jgi:hypothetical protein
MSNPQNEERAAPQRTALPNSTQPPSNLADTAILGNNFVVIDGDRYPVVDVEVNLPLNRYDQDVSFACPHCDQRHWHSTRDAWLKMPGDIIGLRWAHCWNEESPHFGGTYCMRIAGVYACPPREKAKRPRLTKQDRVIVSIGQARAIVKAVAAKDDRFFLTTVIPDALGERRPYALCDSRKNTIAVPACGVVLGSLVSELALLHVPGLGHAFSEAAYQKEKTAIRKIVLAAARELSL